MVFFKADAFKQTIKNINMARRQCQLSTSLLHQFLSKKPASRSKMVSSSTVICHIFPKVTFQGTTFKNFMFYYLLASSGPYGPFLAIHRAFYNKMSVGKCPVSKCHRARFSAATAAALKLIRKTAPLAFRGHPMWSLSEGRLLVP